MKTTNKLMCHAIAVTFAFGLAAFAAGSQAPLKPGAPQVGLATTSPQTSARVTTSAATFIQHVETARVGQKAIVRIEGDGLLAYRTERLDNPERLVLDFSGTRASVARASIPSAQSPVRAVRVGQFRPDVTRVVIDLERPAAHSLQAEGRSLTVVFDAAIAPAATIHPPSQPGSQDDKNAAQVNAAEMATLQRTGASDSRVTPLPEPPTQSAVRPAAETNIGFSENRVHNGMLTFRARNQTLRSIVEQIATKADVAILVADGLGEEQISVEFRQFRVDDALRQILKEYDALFFYGADTEKEGSSRLKAVWVNPPDRGPGINLSSLGAWKSSTIDVDGMLTDPDANVRAQAIVSLIRRKGRESSRAVLAMLKDKSDSVREQTLYRALISGVEIPADTLADLALTDESMNVRYLALQALPVQPTLRWVAERAADDSSPQVSVIAKDILKELDAANAATSRSVAGQHKRPEPYPK